MSEYAHTADGTIISLLDFPPPEANRAPVPLISGQPRVYVPKASSGTPLGDQPIPEWDIYNLVRDVSEPSVGTRNYYQSPPIATYAFSGTLGQASGTVTETIDWTASRLPIAQLYDLKLLEIRDVDRAVRYNAYDTSLSVNWWIICDQNARFELDGIQGNWTQRQIDSQGWPGGANAPWVGIFNATNDRIRRVQVTDAATWNTAYLEKTQHDQAVGNATDASQAALDAAYQDGAGNWEDVANHNASDPTWAYPPTVSLPDVFVS